MPGPRGRGSSRSGVAEWEEPRHPGPALRWGKYPTFSHSATPNAPVVPLRLHADLEAAAAPGGLQDFLGWVAVGRTGARHARRAARRRPARAVARSGPSQASAWSDVGPFRPARVPVWPAAGDELR